MLRIFRITKQRISSQRHFFSVLTRLLGFSPANLSLYQLALRHRSSSSALEKGVSRSNERLEFLGDAILGSIIAHHLFKLFPFKDEGFLTRLRSRLVSRETLNMVALKIGLDELIEKRTHDQIHKSIHGDALEALIGAIYLDRGYQKASKFVIEKMIKPHLDIEELINTEVDFKSRILEWATRNKRQVMFKVESEKRIKGKTQYQISLSIDGSEISQASGWSKKGAEQQAAESAYRKINPENLSAK